MIMYPKQIKKDLIKVQSPTSKGTKSHLKRTRVKSEDFLKLSILEKFSCSNLLSAQVETSPPEIDDSILFKIKTDTFKLWSRALQSSCYLSISLKRRGIPLSVLFKNMKA